MASCSLCDELAQTDGNVAPHEKLTLESSEKYKVGGFHTAIKERYLCRECGTNWLRDNDKQDRHAGWHKIL